VPVNVELVLLFDSCGGRNARCSFRFSAADPWRTFVLITDERQPLLDLVDAALNAAASYARRRAA
jgi:hypothetical protein